MTWSRDLFRLLLKGGVLFGSLAAVIILFEILDLSHLDAAWIDSHIRSKGALGVLLYVAATGVATAVGMPRQAMSFLGGYAFGAIYGTVWATVGTTVGCALGFGYARIFGRSFIMRLSRKRMQQLNDFLARSPLTMTFVIRSMPVGNNAITNLLGGLSSIPAIGFVAGSFLGYIPQNAIFAILGSGMRVDPFWRITIAATLFILSTALGYVLYRRHRASIPVPEPEEPNTGAGEGS